MTHEEAARLQPGTIVYLEPDVDDLGDEADAEFAPAAVVVRRDGKPGYVWLDSTAIMTVYARYPQYKDEYVKCHSGATYVFEFKDYETYHRTQAEAVRAAVERCRQDRAVKEESLKIAERIAARLEAQS